MASPVDRTTIKLTGAFKVVKDNLENAILFQQAEDGRVYYQRGEQPDAQQVLFLVEEDEAKLNEINAWLTSNNEYVDIPGVVLHFLEDMINLHPIKNRIKNKKEEQGANLAAYDQDMLDTLQEMVTCLERLKKYDPSFGEIQGQLIKAARYNNITLTPPPPPKTAPVTTSAPKALSPKEHLDALNELDIKLHDLIRNEQVPPSVKGVLITLQAKVHASIPLVEQQVKDKQNELKDKFLHKRADVARPESPEGDAPKNNADEAAQNPRSFR